MNHFFKISAFVLLLGFAFTLTSMADRPSKELAAVSITLENKCTRDVNYTLRADGKTTPGTVTKGSKKKLDVNAGTVICVDGEDFMTVADADKGQTFVVCR